MLRLLPGERGLLLRDGERTEAYALHHRVEGVSESAEGSELARRIAALTIGSEVEISWEPVRPAKGFEGPGEGAHREASAEGARHEPAVTHAAEAGDQGQPGDHAQPGDHGQPGAVRRWHRRLIVGLEVVVPAAPGQAPTGPAIRSDDLF